jgi:hypothetical protein
MANNRLYIVDRETGEQFYLAKSLGSGWYLGATFDAEALDKWLGERGDWGCTVNGRAPTALTLVDEYRLAEPGEPPPPPREKMIKCPNCGTIGMEVLP